MEMRVLVLGHKGMLGHMVLKYLESKKISVEKTDLRWPSAEFKSLVKKFRGEFIINCIGAIHQKGDLFDVNWELPIFLDFYSPCKIVHPGTDCEMDEDPYGISKKIARDFIINSSKKTKSIKTSIIGPELNSNSSLMEWFLSNENYSSIHGYTNCYWNGNTTLTWSEYALKLILNWDSFEKETILFSDCISKEELLHFLNGVFERKIQILGKEFPMLNKCLSGGIKTLSIKDQLETLKKFYYDRD